MTTFTRQKKQRIFISEIHKGEQDLNYLMEYINLITKLMKKNRLINTPDNSCQLLSEEALGQYWNDSENNIWDHI